MATPQFVFHVYDSNSSLQILNGTSFYAIGHYMYDRSSYMVLSRMTIRFSRSRFGSFGASLACTPFQEDFGKVTLIKGDDKIIKGITKELTIKQVGLAPYTLTGID